MTRPWETIDRADTPDGPLELKRRGTTDFLITLRGRIVMTSAAHRSEDALARLACAHLTTTQGPRVLLSGLGMGFTLRAALDILPPDATVTVAELNAIVAGWCRGPLASLTASALDDPRVTLRIINVARIIRDAAKGPPEVKLEAILLDMYEGPRAASIRLDDPLYGIDALNRANAALAPSGVLAVWCEKPSDAFERNLAQTGFRPERRSGGRGASVHYVIVGHKR